VKPKLRRVMGLKFKLRAVNLWPNSVKENSITSRRYSFAQKLKLTMLTPLAQPVNRSEIAMLSVYE
jgi:hypothetical protein